MRRAFHLSLILAIATAIIAPAFAQDADKKKKKRKDRKTPPATQPVMALLKDITLSAEQKPKIEVIAREWGPKLQAVQKKRTGILTTDQRKAQATARKKAQADGKKGKDAQKAVTDAARLTPEQKTKMATVQKEYREVRTALMKKLGEVLTAEQKAKLPGLKDRKGKGKDARKGKGKKKKKDA